jgi:hypothetical protein
MTCQPPGQDSRTELAARDSNGIWVQLLWTKSTDCLTVAVNDFESGDSFEIVLRDHERPLDVFHHPYAYAAARGVEFAIPQHASV